MNSRIARSLIAGIACAIFALALPVAGSAQAPVSTPSAAADSNLVTFEMIGESDFQLLGPVDSRTILVTLPANWKLATGASLALRLAVSYNVLSTGQAVPNAVAGNALATGGTISVTLNSTLVAVIPLDRTGEIEQVVQIPDGALQSTRPDGRMLLTIALDARFSCYTDQQMSVSVHSTSAFTLPHTAAALSTSLANFPQPIYQGSFVQDTALIVIPDQPSAVDLQEALTLSAGFGNLSGNRLSLDIVPMGKLTPDLEAKNHLIFVGKAATLQSLAGLPLPVPVSSGVFKIPGGAEDDGLVQMINSPWSQSHVVLVVSGNTDKGALKAAQAATTSTLLTFVSPNVAIVQDVQSALVSAPQKTDQTLGDLGYRGRTFSRIGFDNNLYRFYVTPGTTLASDAEFNLIYGHSALLNYDRSGIVVTLNNIPIGSVRLTEKTAAQATNSVHISLPPSAIVPGYNDLNVRVNIVPMDDCSPLSLQGGWVQVWPDSNLHLPLVQNTANPTATLDLARFPAPFMYDTTLGNTAFVLPHDDLAAWQGAVRIAELLGARTSGPLTTLSVFYADSIPEADKSKYNMILIGLPDKLAIMTELNKSLPVPFSTEGDGLPGGNFQVTYRISPGASAGFLQLAASPWNPDNAVLAVLGNTTQGVAWAAGSFIDPILRPQLAGNFDVIDGTQVLTSDTLAASAASASAGQPGAVEAVAPNAPSTQSQAARPGWLGLLLGLAILALVIIVAVVVLRNRSRNKTTEPVNRGS